MLRLARIAGSLSAVAAGVILSGAGFTTLAIPTTFNPTITQALQAVVGHTHLALNAPTLIPTRSKGYLTATTLASPNTYEVTVWDTRHPLHVNNPAIASERLPGGMVARFGAVRLKYAQAPPGDPTYFLKALERDNPVWATGPAIDENQTVTLGTGVSVGHYQSGAQVRLEWIEGDWTIEVAGELLRQTRQAATTVDRFLQTYDLPPDPGIYAVRLQDHGRAAITSIDWVRGSVLSYVSDDHASRTNPIATGAMAVSWRADRADQAITPTHLAPPASAVNGRITITNPPMIQILDKFYRHAIYGVADPQANAPNQMVFLTAKHAFSSPPTTLRHWPPQRFDVYAVLTNPFFQLGGPNGTAWIHELSHDFHLLHKAPGLSLSVTVLPSRSQS